MKILVDQMYQNIYLHLKKIGRDELYSVQEMVEKEKKKMRSDYSVLKLAEKEKMILITEDGQNRIGFEENAIACISLGLLSYF